MKLNINGENLDELENEFETLSTDSVRYWTELNQNKSEINKSETQMDT